MTVRSATPRRRTPASAARRQWRRPQRLIPRTANITLGNGGLTWGDVTWAAFLDYTDWGHGPSERLIVAFDLALRPGLRAPLRSRPRRINEIQHRAAAPASWPIVARAVPDHPGGRVPHGAVARALDHRRRARALRQAPSTCGAATSPTRSSVHSRDQLGELAESFNSMTASIEDLLHAEGGEGAARAGAAHRARHPDVAAAAGAAADGGAVGCRRIASRRAKWAATTTTTCRSATIASACSSPTSPARARRRRSTWRS